MGEADRRRLEALLRSKLLGGCELVE